jgi:fructose-bisphosphate aldolase class 1
MTENTKEPVVTVVNVPETPAKEEKATPATLVDAIFDIGITWAAHGLKVAKGALEASGKTLDTTAKTLDRLAEELGKKDKNAA